MRRTVRTCSRQRSSRGSTLPGAIEDQSFPDAMKERLEQALTKAGVDHKIETYQARHGWVFRDTPSTMPRPAERHWQTMLALFAATLKRLTR
jgi:carboxymethylenebutenolidase